MTDTDDPTAAARQASEDHANDTGHQVNLRERDEPAIDNLRRATVWWGCVECPASGVGTRLYEIEAPE